MIPFSFCPMCASPLTARRIPSNEGPERRVCSACGFIQWGNSKPTASGIVVDESGRALLARRGIEPFKGIWDVPGGFLEAGEHPEDGTRRELLEETGLTVAIVRFIGIYSDTYGPAPSEDTLNVYYECRIVSGTPRAADDVTELAWFAPDDLPDRLAFANADAAVRDWKTALNDKM